MAVWNTVRANPHKEHLQETPREKPKTRKPCKFIHICGVKRNVASAMTLIKKIAIFTSLYRNSWLTGSIIHSYRGHPPFTVLLKGHPAKLKRTTRLHVHFLSLKVTFRLFYSEFSLISHQSDVQYFMIASMNHMYQFNLSLYLWNLFPGRGLSAPCQ